MKSRVKMIVFAGLLVTSTAMASAGKPTKISCGDITFVAPKTLGELPSLEFDYPSLVKIFSHREDNLILVAYDEQETDRVRVVISAQLRRGTNSYFGQIMTDRGGSEMQIDNGPIVCQVQK